MISRLIFASIFLFSAGAFAQAVDFKTLKDASAAGFFRMTCSDLSRPMQAHVYVTVEKNKVTALSLYAISPGESIWSAEYSATDLAGIAYHFDGNFTSITGERPGAYWNEPLVLTVSEDREAKGKFKAHLDWDSNDGEALHRDLTCGAINYILAPST